MSIFQGVHWTYQHHRDRSSSVQTGVIRAKAAMDPVGNEKLGRTSSVFSTLLDDFETTPGITNASRFIESTNWNCIINKISKWKTPFISYVRNSNNNLSTKSWKRQFERISNLSSSLFTIDTKLAPSSKGRAMRSNRPSESRPILSRPAESKFGVQDVKMSPGVTTISSTPRRVAISRRYELLILAT